MKPSVVNEQLSFSEALFPSPDMVPEHEPVPRSKQRRVSAKEFYSRQITLALDFVFGTLVDDDFTCVDTSNEHYEWKDMDVLVLHERMLDITLSLISDNRASKQNRLKSIEWAFSDPILPPEEALQKPMSFQACCIVSYVDPERLREGILFVIRHTVLWDNPLVQDIAVITE